MRVIFMGTPDFAVPTLQAVIDAGHEVAAVFTQPDKAKGRGKAVVYTPVKEKALEYHIPVYQPVKVRDPEVIEQIRQMNPDVIVVVAFGQLLPKTLLDIPPYGCINVHASLLPKYRGAAPIQWAVINGEKISGVTTMYMAEGLDTGDMILKEEVMLDEKETGGSLHDKLSVIGAALLVKTLNMLKEGTAVREKQDDSLKGQYAKMLDKHMGAIDFNEPAEKIERLIRGLNPWPSAYTKLNGKTCKFWLADVDSSDYDGVCGEVVRVTKNDFVIKTGQGGLIVKELQLEGKKRMDAGAFMRGVSIKEGVIFGES
ncbi:MAG: methionyl-tRNA formyltransferase [Clostridiales bacterium]|nr:methionyl-tRNA formyltransferase [Clostridiales bacterium]MDY3745269.1 methionyl-tRNA formyltransferase [Lachnospiraceae bacterium]